MNRNRLWKNAGLAAGFAVVLASPVALHAMVAPPPKPVVQVAKATAAFVPTCTAAAEIPDSRPDPAWVGASFDGDNCWAPAMPATFDATDASRAQVLAAMAAVKSYKAKVGVYQQCIATVVATRKASADKTGKLLDASFVTIENHRVTTGDDNKKKADQRIAAEIEAFNEPGSECGPNEGPGAN